MSLSDLIILLANKKNAILPVSNLSCMSKLSSTHKKYRSEWLGTCFVIDPGSEARFSWLEFSLLSG